jgi:hypothetical protein
MILPEITSEQVSDAMELIPSLWVEKYKIKTSAGLPMEFDSNHIFMRDLFDDMSQLQVWLKPPQIGASEEQLVKTLYCAKKKHWDIIYTLPTDSDRNDMAGGKTNRIIAQNPILGQWTNDHDTVEQKSVGGNIVHYRGTYTQKKAMMVSSDLNVHDEVDASDPDVITQYENRLEAKPDGKRWYFSHPSLAGFGVDIYWQQSDKKEWFVRCPHCKEEVILASQDQSWKDSIDFEKGTYICRKCKGVLNDEDRRGGQWKPTAEGVFSGYHISQLMCPWITARRIIEKKNDPTKDEQFFYNYVLGLPYIGSENKISSEVVLKNVNAAVNTQSDRIIIGVDTGMPWHITCMNSEGAFYYEKLKNVGEIGTTSDYDPKNRVKELLKKWPTSIVIGDQGGELSPLRILQQEFMGRVFLCFYRKDRKTLETIKWLENEDYGTVIVDRNRMFQVMVESLRDLNRIRLNGSREDWQEWASHFDNVYREIKVSKNSPGKDVASNYGIEFIWKRNGADHFCHTLLYALVGMDRFSQGLAKIVPINDRFLQGVQRESRLGYASRQNSFRENSGGNVENI